MVSFQDHVEKEESWRKEIAEASFINPLTKLFNSLR